MTHQAFAIYVPALYVSLSRSLSLPVSPYLPPSPSLSRAGRPAVRPPVCHTHTLISCVGPSRIWGLGA